MFIECSHILQSFPKDQSKSKQEGKAAVLIENVSFFSKKLVQKLYSGMFVVEPQNLLVFIAEQIAVVSLSSNLTYTMSLIKSVFTLYVCIDIRRWKELKVIGR